MSTQAFIAASSDTPPRGSGRSRSTLSGRVSVVRSFVALCAAFVVLTVSACTGGTSGSSASGDAGFAPAPAASGAAGRELPAPVALPPVAERSQWFTITSPTVSVDAKAEDVERAELDSRRRAAPPDGPQFDSRTRSAEPEPTRWMDLAVDVVTRRNATPIVISRANAVFAVAMHDAVVAAAKAGIVDDRAGPDGAAASTLPADVVAAGAAWKAGTALFPSEASRFDRLAAAQKRRSAATGKMWPSTYDAAWAFGVAVGDQVFAQASTDGSNEPPKPWIPPADATWEPTPELFSPPQTPQAATWRPWNLESPGQFLPPPPPKPGSKEFDTALEQLKTNVSDLSDPQNRIARFWEMGPGTSTPAGYWIQEVTIPLAEQSPPDVQVTVLAMTATAIADAGISGWNVKYTYGLGRPVTFIRRSGDPADAKWMPALPTPPHPSYVSGHSIFSAAAAVVLSGLFPPLADRFANAAAEASDSRVVAGIHYWFDCSRGVEAGGRIGKVSLERFGLDADTDLPSSRKVFKDATSKPLDAEAGPGGIKLDG